MIPGPKRRPVYGMAYGTLSGVQSVPRIMRGAPVIGPSLFDIPLTNKRRRTAALHEQGRLTVIGGKTNRTGERTVQVPDATPMSGLESQGLARTLLGSLGGSTLGADIEMPEECMRPGEILLSPGVCGPDPHRGEVSPYSAQPPTYAIPVSTTKASPQKSSPSKLSPQLLMLGGVAVAAILYFGRK